MWFWHGDNTGEDGSQSHTQCHVDNTNKHLNYTNDRERRLLFVFASKSAPTSDLWVFVIFSHFTSHKLYYLLMSVFFLTSWAPPSAANLARLDHLASRIIKAPSYAFVYQWLYEKQHHKSTRDGYAQWEKIGRKKWHCFLSQDVNQNLLEARVWREVTMISNRGRYRLLLYFFDSFISSMERQSINECPRPWEGHSCRVQIDDAVMMLDKKHLQPTQWLEIELGMEFYG